MEPSSTDSASLPVVTLGSICAVPGFRSDWSPDSLPVTALLKKILYLSFLMTLEGIGRQYFNF